MSVFYHNDDPLLYNRPLTIFNDTAASNNMADTYANMYRQQMLKDLQQNSLPSKDWLGELDDKVKGLDEQTASALEANEEFRSLNGQLQSLIQSEIMAIVKVKVNSYPNAVDNMRKQMSIIENVERQVKNDERQSMNDLNDYMKNYSHLTFDDYKRLKYNDDTIPETVEAKPMTKNQRKRKN